MAVIVADRKEGKLEVLERISELYDYSSQLCQSEKYFPKRTRWLLANRILNGVIEAGEAIAMANSLSLDTIEDYSLRREYQAAAKAHLFRVLYLIELAYKDKGHHVSGRQADYWVGLVENTLKKLAAWVRSDKERRKRLMPE